MTREKDLGDRGERAALDWLQRKGLELVTQNYHAQGGEIDLIMRDPETDEYVLVEVKTRESDAFGDGWEAITPEKIEKMLRAAEAFFLKEMNAEEMPFFRIDGVVVRVDGERLTCEHREAMGDDAFA